LAEGGRGVSLRTYNKDQEDDANWLAGCILLPREALLYARRCGINTFKRLIQQQNPRLVHSAMLITPQMSAKRPQLNHF
jgi:hypothetical protein